MKLKFLVATILLAATSLVANEFVDYKELTKQLKAEAKENGTFASISDVKKALNAKDWIVADVRTLGEWNAAHIKGSVRIGRQAPEKALGGFVLDLDDNFIKQNIVIVCNSASRASIEAQAIKQMGFKDVKIFNIYQWIDACNPVNTGYSKKKYKSGTKNKFGAFLAEHCYKK